MKIFVTLFLFILSIYKSKCQSIPGQYHIVIDEIMVDPSPPVSLPNNKWIELKNTTTSPISVQGWKIGDASGVSGILPSFILLPDSFLIVCSNSSVAAMSVYGSVVGVSNFPSLNITGENLYLLSPQNKVIHSISYHSGWYQNPLKKDGGWALEMIDSRNPCNGINNWKASIDISGGSPGKINAVNGVNADQVSPKLLRAYAADRENLLLVFDEPLDSTKAAGITNYNISDGIGSPQSATPIAPAFDRVSLKLSTPLSNNKIYTITASALVDCAGNSSAGKTARVGISEVADSFDLVINEILFNPPSNGTDYVELYNRGKKIIELKQTYIANRNSSNAISNIRQLSTESHLLFPGDFIVITESVAQVRAAYIAQNLDGFIEISGMPSFNNDKGSVIVLNAQGNITDELNYNEKWHFELIDNREGVSLERIEYNAATQLKDNWHSAATSAGYGTPTFKNSQYRINDGVAGEVKLSPEIVSPDNDGQDDYATVDYKFPEGGYIANITIFDAQGRVIRYLQRNSLCGVSGSFRWDGLGEKNQRLAIGVYIVFTDVFNLSGRRKQFKTAIVLARRS